ncbi:MULTISPECIES: tetratricopeptide repeat protein [unclassified Pseudodesulfovibrio]|uniref:tetratricopeptide repeat protein n=1 Tax=unclassified Pseudodesulfovibrio TaxID=2661612 RepID=UPI000FEBF5A9|nr:MULTISPECIES: tetratricopeptide repeat protein [unclassified Pseudodesulfovibrio]MCJ2165874.1 tetratricopeptide repeat protein [Pseudodesulfovibrio sp. S3-i]RWU02695.1 tetratricopeptide repeat protein [Pseudodesulfovibrio sp. S3]
MTTNENGLIESVFSIERMAKIGTGTTARRAKQTALYYVREVENGVIELQGLNNKHVPFGPVETITKDELLSDYLPMPQLYSEVIGNLRKVQKSVARGDKFRKRGENFTAEYEYANALNLDEQNVRANFGIGLCLLARGEEEKAKSVFDRIIRIDSVFEDDHKHLFNEYGIALRKNNLIGQAVDYYRRALELSANDENLWYNLARAQYERQDWAKCAEAVTRCLQLAPSHPEGKKMMEYLTKKGLV